VTSSAAQAARTSSEQAGRIVASVENTVEQRPVPAQPNTELVRGTTRWAVPATAARAAIAVPDDYHWEPLQYARPESPESLNASTAFLRLLSRRRSVRQFSSEPVSYDLVRNAVATAATAPWGTPVQPWTFVVVRDGVIRRGSVGRSARWSMHRISSQSSPGLPPWRVQSAGIARPKPHRRWG
jgi:hypothetical protein